MAAAVDIIALVLYLRPGEPAVAIVAHEFVGGIGRGLYQVDEVDKTIAEVAQAPQE